MNRKKLLRIALILMAVAVAVPVVALAAIIGISKSRQDRVWELEGETIAYTATAEFLAEGSRLWYARGCADCHGQDGAGRVLLDEPPIGRVVPTNVTQLGADYTIADFELAVRHGVGRDRTALQFMPAHEFERMRDEQVAALYAHMVTLAPVVNELPVATVGPVGRILHVMGAMPMFPAELVDPNAIDAPEPAPTADYGSTLARGCSGCHGATYSGGPIPGAPVEKFGTPLNLTPHATGLAGWDFARFERLMREGTRADGTVVDTVKMPWQTFRHMSDVEMQALWAFLQTVPPIEFGNR